MTLGTFGTVSHEWECTEQIEDVERWLRRSIALADSGHPTELVHKYLAQAIDAQLRAEL